MFSTRLTPVLLASLTALSTVSALNTISAYGAKLFTSDGAQFFIKGVAYQLTSDDPLVDTTQCTLDASLMKTLGANSIRVYHVDASADHDGCMSAFSDAGIYVWLDLDTFDTTINATSPSWPQFSYNAFAKVMDTFQSYDNVAGFFVGNEVLTTGADSIAAPYVKAAARDMKAYRDSKGYREIPIGYSAADIASLRPNLQNYLACGGNASEAVDFFSLNAYEWCGDSSYSTSGYSELEANATDYNIPIFFSETGCNTPEPRTFGDQAAIFGSDMDSTWSGAIIYEWIEETNNYGLISYGPSVAATATGTNIVDGFTRGGTPTPISPDFDNLSTQWASASPTSTSSADYSPSNSAPSCPAYTSGLWEVSGNVALPTLGDAASVSGSGSGSTTASATSSGSGSGSSGTTKSTGSGSGSATGGSASSTSKSSAATARPVRGSWVQVAGSFVVVPALAGLAAL